MSFHVHNRLKAFFDYKGNKAFASKGHVTEADQKFILFDAYYASLMVGFKRRKPGSESDLESGYFIDHFPEPYLTSREYIVGLLIDSELRHLEGDRYSKRDIERTIVKLLAPNSATRLSKEGMKAANLYASHGFEVIEDLFKIPPSSVPNFFTRYNEFWATGKF